MSPNRQNGDFGRPSVVPLVLSFFGGLALLRKLAQCISEIARGAFDPIGCGLQCVGLVAGALGDSGQRCVDLLSQAICLIFGFLFCASFL